MSPRGRFEMFTTMPFPHQVLPCVATVALDFNPIIGIVLALGPVSMHLCSLSWIHPRFLPLFFIPQLTHLVPFPAETHNIHLFLCPYSLSLKLFLRLFDPGVPFSSIKILLKLRPPSFLKCCPFHMYGCCSFTHFAVKNSACHAQPILAIFFLICHFPQDIHWTLTNFIDRACPCSHFLT